MFYTNKEVLYIKIMIGMCGATEDSFERPWLNDHRIILRWTERWLVAVCPYFEESPFPIGSWHSNVLAVLVLCGL